MFNRQFLDNLKQTIEDIYLEIDMINEEINKLKHLNEQLKDNVTKIQKIKEESVNEIDLSNNKLSKECLEFFGFYFN